MVNSPNFLPSAHDAGRRVLCPAPSVCPSVHPSICPTLVTTLQSTIFNSLRPRQNGRLFADDVFKRIFLNENVWISLKISLKFVPKVPINNIPALVQIMARRHPGDKLLSEPMMVNLLTHICVARPQLVNGPCSYLFQPLTLVWARILLIMGFLCSFSRIQWHFEILWIHWLACLLNYVSQMFPSPGWYFQLCDGVSVMS